MKPTPLKDKFNIKTDVICRIEDVKSAVEWLKENLNETKKSFIKRKLKSNVLIIDYCIKEIDQAFPDLKEKDGD